ncbi:hypothetical protein [uncultured Methylobacterium sp.]|uniref:PIN-like domain-containing protein n=1 Tax=uncultured Methylobacterium sp. TaxID=157278 RepID=UPI0035C98EDC
MKVFFDHNMSPALARAVRELFHDWHEITILSEEFRRDATDMEVITAFKSRGPLAGDLRGSAHHEE